MRLNGFASKLASAPNAGKRQGEIFHCIKVAVCLRYCPSQLVKFGAASPVDPDEC